MTTIVFNGLTRDDKRISFVKFLSNKANIGIKEAKEISDRIIDGKVVELPIFNKNIAVEIVSEANKLGYNCKILTISSEM